MYDALYNMNVGCDLVNTSSKNLEQYKLIVVPPLYTVSDSLLNRLNKYVENGGHIIYAFKSGFSNENTQVRASRMPGLLRKAAGFSYQQFTNIDKLPLKGDPFKLGAANYVSDWAEMLTPETCKVLAYYDHPYWGKYAAITQNNYGKGSVTYFGAMPSPQLMQKLLADEVKSAGILTPDQGLAFPVITKTGVNEFNKQVRYYFNYSGIAQTVVYKHAKATDLLTGKKVEAGKVLTLAPWNFIVIEED